MNKRNDKYGKLNEEKGITIISVVFIMLALSAVGLSMTSAISNTAMTSVVDVQKQQAFYVAEAGLQYVLADQVLNSADLTTSLTTINNKAFGEGTFSTTYSNVTATSADITVTAAVGDSIRIVEQTVSITPGSAMPWGNAIYALADIHVNSGSGTIDGNIEAGGSIAVDNAWTITGTSTSSSTQPVPSVVLQDYVDLTASTHSGDLSISGTYTGDIYATGDVTIEDGATVTGIIVSGGNTLIGDNVSITGTAAAGGTLDTKKSHGGNYNWAVGPSGETLPVFASIGTMTLKTEKNALVSMSGFIQTNSDFHFITKKDTLLDWTGFAIAKGDVHINNSGTIDLTFDETLANGLSAPGSIDLTAWKES